MKRLCHAFSVFSIRLSNYIALKMYKMNKLVSILMIILFANTSFSQTNNYSNLWTAVENFEIEGLPKSALKALEKIEIKAKAENNSPQLIKIMLFKS